MNPRLIAVFVLFSLFIQHPRIEAYTREPLRGDHFMIATTRPIASQIGADILRKGGTAVDAAVAVGFALAVIWPRAGNIGGGGFLLHRSADGKAEAIDYRGTAPL